MTESDLEKLVHSGDTAALVLALAPLCEGERHALAKFAAGWLRDWRKTKQQVIRDIVARTHSLSSSDPDYQKVEAAESAAQLAVLGLCGWSEAKDIPSYIYPSPHVAGQHILAVFRARRPNWLDQWVAKELAARSTNWHLIRTLIRDGLCRRPTDPRYIVQMVGMRFGWRWDFNCSLADLLRQDRDLLENEFWTIFEIDLGDRQLLTIEDFDFSHTGSPATALRELTRTCELDRARILSATLDAPLHNSMPNNAAWFCRLHQELAPSLEERCECQSAYLELLSSSFPTVVGFALDALKVIASDGRLDVRQFAQHIAPAFTTGKKTHAATALQILKLASKHAPQVVQCIAVAATHGLAHAKSDVQARALGLISAIIPSPDAVVADALEPRLDSIAASLRPIAQQLLARLRGSVTHVTTGSGAVVAGVGITSLAPWRTLAGLDTCIAAIEQGTDLRPVIFDPMSVPHLDAANRLQPIHSLDQLIEQLSAAVEGLDDADQLELLIDGMCRFTGSLSIDFAAQTAPLLKRARDVQKSPNLIYGPLPLLALIEAWITRTHFGLAPTLMADPRMPMCFVARRLAEINRRLFVDSTGPLLACPTHKGGWIDPRELVVRLIHWQTRAQSDGLPALDLRHPAYPGRLDLIQALLRLAPDHRAAALAPAAEVRGEIGSALRYALGTDESVSTDVDLWIAATRARHPNATCPPLASKPAASGPDAAAPATLSWSPAIRTGFPEDPYICSSCTPVLHGQPSWGQPTVQLHQDYRGFWGIGTALEIRCLATIWPADLETYFLRGASEIAARLDKPGSTFSPVGTYLDPLFDQQNPFSELAQVAVSLALLSRDAGAKGMGIDAMIALIDDGRSLGHEFGPIITKLSTQPGFVHLNRLAAALQELSRISELHHYAAINVGTSTLASLAAPPPADLHHLLSFMHDSLAATGQPLPATTHPILQSVSGTGKSAKLARALLTHKPTPNPAWKNAVYHRALQGRLTRSAASTQK